jgi:hypothetical protein
MPTGLPDDAPGGKQGPDLRERHPQSVGVASSTARPAISSRYQNALHGYPVSVASTFEVPAPDLTRRIPAAMVGVGLAAALCAVWLLLPPTGSDLSAQVAHADFAAKYLWHPVNLQWFGGTSWLGYSVLVPPLMAVIGVQAVGVLATVASSGLLGLLMTRCRVLRPRAGAAAGALCLVGNLVVGRLTFAVGLTLALATVTAFTLTHRVRWIILAVGPVLTWAASPLAALFLGLAVTAFVLWRRGGREGIVVIASTTLALGASFLLGQGGYMPAPIVRGVLGLTACIVVALTAGHKLVRIGALVAAAGVVLSFTLQSQVGMNAIRLPAMFAAPILIATSRLRTRVLAPAVALTVCIVPPLQPDDVTAIGSASNNADYYTEVVNELETLPLTGRVEIPPTLQRWESVYVAQQIPLARGWMTQLDAGYDTLFFNDDLDAASYRSWLRQNAVQYVAVPDAEPASAGQAETELIDTGLAYLRPIWTGEHWTIYRVANPTSTVAGGTLVSQDAVSVTFRASQPTDVHVRVRWSRWLTLAGPAGCLRREGDWIGVEVQQPGVYTVGSAFDPEGHRSCDS